MNERKLLAKLKHPFLVNMIFAFQNRENLYLIMDLLTGGDLRYHISRTRKFPEKTTSKEIFNFDNFQKNFLLLAFWLDWNIST